jgi:hypothetical protein
MVYTSNDPPPTPALEELPLLTTLAQRIKSFCGAKPTPKLG